MKKAVFIDRDGTLNIDEGYTHKISDFKFISGAEKAIKLLNDNGFLAIIVTNQAGVARGYYEEKDVEELHNHINKTLKKNNARIDSFYYCPHHVKEGIGKYKKDCDCRKPNIGMFKKAIKDFKIDISNSWMIGDKLDDMTFGENCGLKTILVETGHGKDVKGKYLRNKDLLEAVEYILKLKDR